MTRKEVVTEITRHFSLEDFLRMQERLIFLRKEEELKLKALAELQTAYVAAITEQERETVKITVGQIRELSRKTREEIRSINSLLYQRIELAKAKELYAQYLATAGEGQSPK